MKSVQRYWSAHQLTRAGLRNYTSIDLCRSGQVNEHAPRTFGDGIIHSSQFDALVKGDLPLPEIEQRKTSAIEQRIGKIIAESLVEDGATMQFGRWSHAVISLNSRLRVDSLEMFSLFFWVVTEQSSFAREEEFVRLRHVNCQFATDSNL
jgi:hypothetical protein